MHKRVHDPDPHVRPRRLHSRRVINPQVSEGEDGADEERGLLVQVA